MCGIVGRFSIEPVPDTTDLWDELVDTMWRRGPDDRGLLADERCVLGARRLAVMDPSGAGHLPMRSDCGRYRLAFNGELYNFRDLRAQLERAGHRFRSSGDSEVVLRSLQHWGPAALERFNGMFALAYRDRVDQSLLLARDHAGIKPLYVLTDPRGVVFASQFDQIMAHPWADGRPVDPEAVAMYLRLGHIPAPRAYLAGTEMLPPGSWLRVDAAGRTERRRYVRFEPGGRKRPSQEEIEATVRTAVARQSVSDAPVGCLLSGGIDSPLVAAYAGDARLDPLPTFSIGMEDADLDESADARRYATEIGSAHRVRTLGAAQVDDLLADAVDATCEPLADEGILPALLVSGLAREHVTVALSGEGGDELFWGYYPRQSAVLGGRDLDHFGHRYLAHFADFTRAQFTSCFPGLDWWPAGEPAFDTPHPADPAEAVRRVELDVFLPFILLKADRASMYHSLEVRVPLLDREVVDLAAGLSGDDCLDLDAGVGKAPLRRALRTRLGLGTSGKRGFTAPMDTWARTVLRDRIADSLRTVRGLESVDVDLPALRGLLDRHGRGEENNGMALWRVLCLDLWVGKQRAAAGKSVRCGC